MSIEHYEYAIIGGGKAGKSLAARMALAGRSTVLIERGMIGGSCINVACIPTKTMVHSAKVLDMARHAARFGINVTLQGPDIVGVKSRRDSGVGEMVQRNQANFDRSGMTLVIGSARFTGPKSIEVSLAQGGTRQISSEKVFINTGTRPAMPDLPGLADLGPLTSDTIQQLRRLPEHLVILGGGYIGLEFAQMFRRFGSQVTIIDRNNQFLPREEPEIARSIQEIFRKDGIEWISGATVESFKGISGKEVQLLVQTATGSSLVKGSDLLVAMGRTPGTGELNLNAAGVETDQRGFIKVNDRLETTAKDVWALGDVNGGPQFTHASFDDFRIVTANLEGGNRTTNGRLIPYTLFIDPELGRIGLTEEEARKKGLTIKVASLPAAAIPRAVTKGETQGLLKAVVDAKTDLILGASILAPEGGEIMAVVQMAMQGGLTATKVRDTIFSHPSMSEALNDLFSKLK